MSTSTKHGQVWQTFSCTRQLTVMWCGGHVSLQRRHSSKHRLVSSASPSRLPDIKGKDNHQNKSTCNHNPVSCFQLEIHDSYDISKESSCSELSGIRACIWLKFMQT